MSRVHRFAALAAAGALLAACDAPDEPAPEPNEIVTQTPRIEATAIEGYSGFAGDVTAIALLPNAQPPLGRAVAALNAGGFVVIDLAFGEVTPVEGPRVGALAAAPGFQLRGSPAPLLLAAGGELAHPQAWVFLADENALVEIPSDPIAPDATVRGLCVSRETPAYLDVVVLTDASAQTWRVSDRGGETLAAEMTSETPLSRPADRCAVIDGALATVADNGMTRLVDDRAWGFSDGADVVAAPPATDAITPGSWGLVARPDAGRLSAISPSGDEVEVGLEAGLNTPVVREPGVLAASTANFGASFNTGVLMVAYQDRVNVLALDTLVDAAAGALNPRAADATSEPG